MKNHFGFTLAEVLITLGIIGVVAAMTMPTLMNSTQGAQYKAAYKKALSALSQAVTLNVALDDTSFADTIAGEAGKTTAGNGKDDETKTTGTTVASLLDSRMNIVNPTGTPGYDIPTVEVLKKDPSGKMPGDTGYTKTADTVTADTYLFFNDGIMFAFDSTKAFGCQAPNPKAGVTGKICSGFIDVNGQKGPNKLVTCDNGTNSSDKPCTVTNPTDIYPVQFYDQTVLPASEAATAVLYGK